MANDFFYERAKDVFKDDFDLRAGSLGKSIPFDFLESCYKYARMTYLAMTENNRYHWSNESVRCRLELLEKLVQYNIIDDISRVPHSINLKILSLSDLLDPELSVYAAYTKKGANIKTKESGKPELTNVKVDKSAWK